VIGRVIVFSLFILLTPQVFAENLPTGMKTNSFTENDFAELAENYTDVSNLPSSQDYPFESLSGAICNGEPSICYGTFQNGTQIQIQCDYLTHGCFFPFDDYSAIFKPDSPLKQFKNKVPFYEIKCKEGLQLTQKYDGTHACVKPDTYFELLKRNWTSNIIKAIQSRDLVTNSSFLANKNLSVDDFKKILAESHDLNTIFTQVGGPHDDIGSGIHIFVYDLSDSSQIWIGYADHILYVRHVDSQGVLLGELFSKNQN